MNRETRIFAASPMARLNRMPGADRKLLLLLVSLGPDAARERLLGFAPERREVLAPLLAELLALPSEERRALFAPPPEPRPKSASLNPRLAREPKRLASLMIRELAPRRAPLHVVDARPRDPAFARTLAKLAARWLDAAR